MSNPPVLGGVSDMLELLESSEMNLKATTSPFEKMPSPWEVYPALRPLQDWRKD